MLARWLDERDAGRTNLYAGWPASTRPCWPVA
ncbi:Uncharacterised protein [Bordetella pertussis]|nr:Uncharacterised protein [Bordetella pertussis]